MAEIEASEEVEVTVVVVVGPGVDDCKVDSEMAPQRLSLDKLLLEHNHEPLYDIACVIAFTLQA